MDLNTSFSGDDLLYTRVKSGNVNNHFADSADGTYLSATNTYGDALKIDKIWYQFPVGDNLQFWIGPRIENYYMVASSPSIYKPVLKQFALGGNGPVYGSSTTGGFGAAWTQEVEDPSDGRFAISAGYTSKGDETPDADNGLFGKYSQTALLTKVEYGTPQWQVSVAGGFKEGGWSDSYYATTDAKVRATGSSETAIGFRAWWKPEETGIVPAISFGYDTTTVDNNGSDVSEAQGWMVGMNWKDVIIDGNKAGAAFGQRVHATDFGGSTANSEEAADDTFSWEAYYTFQVNDNVSITPAFFGNEKPAGGEATDGNSGYLVLTEFRF